MNRKPGVSQSALSCALSVAQRAAQPGLAHPPHPVCQEKRKFFLTGIKTSPHDLNDWGYRRATRVDINYLKSPDRVLMELCNSSP